MRDDPRTIRPMLATLEDAPLDDESLIYEPKYDGIRALVAIDPSGVVPAVRIWSRLGNDKTAQFPDIVAALKRYAKKLKGPVLLDGEIVALDEAGEPAGFQMLQGRIHLSEPSGPSNAVAFIAFDILRDRNEDLRPLPLTARRARLERVFRNPGSPILRLSDISPGDGRAMYRTALEHGWEGIIVKRADSVYQTGKRSHDWRKLKIIREQEFVVGGWTESRTTRRPFGALLLGYYEHGRLVYSGHTGSGFDQRELERVAALLKPLEMNTAPFADRPRTNERPHWVRPVLVAQLKFGEWTADGKLRQPIYLGLRDDVKPESVRREPDPVLHATSARPVAAMKKNERSGAGPWGHSLRAAGPTPRPDAARVRARAGSRLSRSEIREQRLRLTAPAMRRAVASGGGGPTSFEEVQGSPRVSEDLVEQLEAMEKGPGGGVLRLPGGLTLEVSNLRKIFWPKLKITKGELLRYYVRVSPFILPVVADRPLVMKRFPNGVTGKAFYQQRAPSPVTPGVRIATIPSDDDPSNDEVPSRLIGGSLLNLLYMTQLAVISQDPWFSRVQSPDEADHAALDLDPMPGMKFAQVLNVARWIRDELEKLNVPNVPKTSGASGLHIYIPLQRGTPSEAGMIFCQIVATMVATKHPKVATVERSVHARGQKVYVDYLQNIRGKTLACAYSARASDYAGASTPLTWKEIDEGVDPRDFTVRTLPARLADVGDLWKPLLKSKGADLRAVTRE